jgi:hypothetical protein
VLKLDLEVPAFPAFWGVFLEVDLRSRAGQGNGVWAFGGWEYEARYNLSSGTS